MLRFLAITGLTCVYILSFGRSLPRITNVTLTKSGEHRWLLHFNLENQRLPSLISVTLHQENSLEIDPSTFSLTGDCGDRVYPGLKKCITIQSANALDIKKIVLTAQHSEKDLIEEALLYVSVDSLAAYLNLLCEPRHHMLNPDAVNVIASSIETHFRAVGLAVEGQDFNFNKQYRGRNIIGYNNADKRIPAILMGAHFDTVENSSGADDNATGVAALFEIARIVRDFDVERRIAFAAFDLEEEGKLGSQHFTTVNQHGNLLGYINLDMVGYAIRKPYTQPVPDELKTFSPATYEELEQHAFKADFLLNFSDDNSALLRAAFDSTSKLYVPALKVISFSVPSAGADYPEFFRASDHVSFWDKGVPAISVGDTGDLRNPNYHSSFDTIDTVDMEFFSAAVKATLACVLHLAGVKGETAYTLHLN